MKRLLTISALAICITISASAQDVWCHFGLQGGLSLNKFTTEIKSNYTGWHAGAALLIKMPAFFAIQPAVQFEQSRSAVVTEEGQGTMNVNTINVPIPIQWGPDLGFCRVFVEAVPYLDFNLGGKLDIKDSQSIKDYLSTVQFGLGAGAGIDIWRFQLSARYNWGLGNWQKISEEKNPFRMMKGNKQGVTITLAYFFN